MTLRLNLDYKLIGIVAALLGVGLPMVFSASHLLAYSKFGEAAYFMQRQALWIALGCAVMIACSQIPYAFWRRVSIVAMVFTLFVLVVILAIGVATNGARRWALDGSFQPSELAKLVTVIYVGHWLASRKDKLQQITYGLIPFYVIVGGVAGLVIMQPDLSTGIVIGFTAVAMFFAAGAPIGQLVVSTLALSGVAGSMLVLLVQWRMTRLMLFIEPLKHKADEGYQIYQMLLAMGSGGWLGNGFSSLGGTIGYLPASHTDAIFAVIGNDFGIVGCTLVILLFILFARQGLLIAERAPDAFGYLLAVGITSWLICQALLNIASTTASIPFTGIPLPFISFGGSALVAALAGVGVLLNIAQSGRAVRPSRRASK
ncbi:MAG: putative peptidoglycan glycosyltransferase FtsW [Chloroflexota bacterium]